ncbi:MAG TPA: hypothetical protein VGN91_20685, partial [Bosea sp. (in: a-proteobacteria)]|nr:hypothetical protein [Bosea sp. (in: a-proteobacteria)]
MAFGVARCAPPASTRAPQALPDHHFPRPYASKSFNRKRSSGTIAPPGREALMTPMLFWGLTPFDFLALAIFMVCWQ